MTQEKRHKVIILWALVIISFLIILYFWFLNFNKFVRERRVQNDQEEFVDLKNNINDILDKMKTDIDSSFFVEIDFPDNIYQSEDIVDVSLEKEDVLLNDSQIDQFSDLAEEVDEDLY